jgi:1-acyl-sn-glycerol-3-phosphate acyltransferase
LLKAVQLSANTLPLWQRSWGARVWFSGSYRLIGCLLRLLYRVHIAGAEHIPAQGGVVLVSNHLSLLDTLLIPYSVMACAGVQVVWAPAKAELFAVPLLGRIIASWGAFPVHRGRGDLRAMRRMLQHMQTEKVMLFPEGTRSQDGRLGEGKRAVGKLLYSARPVVIPVAVWGTDRVLPAGRRFPRLRLPIGVHYGPPVDLQRFYTLPDTKDTAQAIIAEVMGAIAALAAQHGAAPSVSASAVEGRG